MSELTRFAKLVADKMQDEQYKGQMANRVMQSIIYRVVEEMEAEEKEAEGSEESVAEGGLE